MFRKTEAEIMRGWRDEKAHESQKDSKDSRQKPILSVLCVTFNHARFIAQALDGFLMQETNFAFEIIIHDDCSTDGTTEIVKAYAARYPRIIRALFEEENQYSRGGDFLSKMHEMAGKYVALCEGDDYWRDPKKLQIQVDFMEANPRYVVCFEGCEVLDSSGKIAPSGYPRRDGSGAEMQHCHLVLPTRCALYRNVVDFFEPNLARCRPKVLNGDTFLWILLGKFGDAKFLPQIAPSVYRLHAGGVWSSLEEETRLKIHAKSFYYISQYLRAVGDENLASYFLALSLQNLTQAGGVNLTNSDFSRVVRTLVEHSERGGKAHSSASTSHGGGVAPQSNSLAPRSEPLRGVGGGASRTIFSLFFASSSRESIVPSKPFEIGLKNGANNERHAPRQYLPHNGFGQIHPALH